MRGTGGKAEIPGYDVPAAGAYKSAEDYAVIYYCDIYYTLADGIGNMQAEEKESHKIKNRRPQDGVARRKDPGRHDSGY
jgi:hypothetical protein